MAGLRVAAFCLLAAVCVVSVQAHGGTFHESSSTPENKNYIRNKVGTCTKWVDINSTSNAAKPAASIDVMGAATLWSYRYKNCSDSLSVCVEVNLTFTDDGKPVVGKNITGYSHVGSCSASSGPGARYKLNASVTAADELERTWVWFHDGVTNNSGRIWGQGANDGLLSTASPDGVKSFVLYDDATEEPIACCDFVLSGPATTNWTAILPAGVVCEGDGHGGHSGMDHSGMDHSGHNMNGTNTTKPTNAGSLTLASSVQWLFALLLLAVLL